MKHKPLQIIGLWELYLRFRMKYRDVTKPAGMYHFPKEQISSSPYALEFKEWKLIVQVYFKHVLAFLKTGTMYPLPYGLGYWQLVKKKENRRIMLWKEGQKAMAEGKLEKGRFLSKKQMFFNGWYPRLRWHKHGSQHVKFKNMSKVRLCMIKQYWREYWRELKDTSEGNKLFNLNDG